MAETSSADEGLQSLDLVRVSLHAKMRARFVVPLVERREDLELGHGVKPFVGSQGGDQCLNCSVSVLPTRASVSLSGLSAVAIRSK